MGCSESVPVAPGGENALGVIQSSPIDVNQSQQWKVKPTRSEAKKAYIADGSLTESNADKLVEIRTLLDDPMFLGGLGEFSKHVHKYELLALWADILEYKEMDAKSNEMMLSQALHVYHKYIKVSNADDDAHTTSERAPAVCPFLPEDAENLRVTLIDAASKAALGDEASPNISDAADTDGIAGADAGAGTDGISGADAGTGTDGIAGADADAGTDGNENLLSLHLLDVFQQTCVECIYKDLFLPFAGTDTYKSLAAKMKKAYNCVVADNFEYVGLIGSGSFGIVVHAIKKSTKKHYAMKIQRKVGLLETFSNCMERVVSEKEAVASCHHPFIVSMDYAFQSTGLVFMVMDLGTSEFFELKLFAWL